MNPNEGGFNVSLLCKIIGHKPGRRLKAGLRRMRAAVRQIAADTRVRRAKLFIDGVEDDG